ncbi:MAG: TspO/MBR family protein [Acetobacteraceae bacterium]
MGFIGLCLLVGAADSALTAGAARAWYLSLTPPPGTPPDQLFGPVWAALYIMVGIAGWMVWRRSSATRPLRLWGWQLAVTAIWAPAFFGLHRPLLGVAVLAILIVLTVLTIRSFRPIHRGAARLMVPYLLWIGYTLYLNAGFCWLNPV